MARAFLTRTQHVEMLLSYHELEAMQRNLDAGRSVVMARSDSILGWSLPFVKGEAPAAIKTVPTIYLQSGPNITEMSLRMESWGAGMWSVPPALLQRLLAGESAPTLRAHDGTWQLRVADRPPTPSVSWWRRAARRLRGLSPR